MASSYSAKTGLEIPGFDDLNWDVPLRNTFNAIDSLAPVGGLAVRAKEIPSASLNVSVAGGAYRGGNGAKLTFSGVSTQAVTSSATRVLYVDASNALQVASAYPTNAFHVPLATVVTGTSTITSIADDRVPGGSILWNLGNYTNDSAAATGGVPVNGIYRDSSGVVHIRIS